MLLPSISRDSFARTFAIFVIVLGILVGGTWAAVKVTTDHFLYQDATSTARSWARFLAASVTDLEQIAGGEQPWAASMAFLQSAQIRRGFSLRSFNRDGFGQLVSDRDKVALVQSSEHDADAARSAISGQPIVEVKEGRSGNQPDFFARAYVPIRVGNQTIAVVAAYVDETEHRANFHTTFLIASASLCVLMCLAFTVPAIAWYRRTEEKQRVDRRIRFLAHHLFAYRPD